MNELSVGDIVVLHYNNRLGYIFQIHKVPAGPLHDVKGLDGFCYPNQFASELTLVRGIGWDQLVQANSSGSGQAGEAGKE